MSIITQMPVASLDYPWFADQKDGTFRNPLMAADFPDPDAIRDGDDYFMTVSSFHCAPGLPILHSRDLVNWTIINHALPRLPHSRYDAVQPGCGVWAPSIRKHAGKFWIFFPTPDEGIFCTTADHPAGRWSEPWIVAAGHGLIDPCPLWDDDGRAYLVHAYAHSRSGIKHQIRMRPMAADGSKLLGEGKIIFDDPVSHPTAEGPKLYKRNGYYYVLAPAGGVETGWQLGLRSKNIYGPYEHRIILEQGSTPINGPHQGALIDTSGGEWWFLHFQDAQLYGRIPHLQPARWVDDWPMIGVDYDGNGIGEPVGHCRMPDASPSSPTPESSMLLSREWKRSPPYAENSSQTSDEFDALSLSPQWHWNANPSANGHSLSVRPGWCRLFTQRFAVFSEVARAICEDAEETPQKTVDIARIPSILLQKLPAFAVTAEVAIELHTQRSQECAGFAIIGRQSAALHLGKQDAVSPPSLTLELVIDGRIHEQVPLPDEQIRLFIHIANGGECRFGYQRREDDNVTWLTPSFQATAGVWVGAKIGLYSVSFEEESSTREISEPSDSYIDVDYLRYHQPSLAF